MKAISFLLPHKHTIKVAFLATCLFFFILIPFTQSNADPLDYWNWRNPLPQGNNLNTVRYLNSMFIAVGDSGTIITSHDGEAWTTKHTGYKENLNGIVYARSKYVVVGSGGTILTSTDGVVWTKRNSGTTKNLYGIAYGNSTFVAIGQNGTVLTSPDGVSWASDIVILDGSYGVKSYDLREVFFINSIFIVSLDNAEWSYITSSDGLDWVQRNWITYDISGFAASNNTIVAIGHATGEVSLSHDGVVWSTYDLPTIDNMGLNPVDIAYIDSEFVILTSWGHILTSPDGFNWEVHRSSSNINFMSSLAYGNGTYVFVGTEGKMFKSVNRTSWTQLFSALDDVGSYNMDIVFGDSKFVSVGFPSSGVGSRIVTSVDGVEWIERISPCNCGFISIAYGNSTFVAVGLAGVAATSNNGIDWTIRDTGVTRLLSDVIYADNKFVAVGDSGTIITSIDGEEWTTIPPIVGIGYNHHGISYGDSTFLIVGSGSSEKWVATSTDGVTWSLRDLETPLYKVTYADSKFFASTGGNTIFISSDGGVTWVPKDVGSSNFFSRIVYDNSMFIGVGGYGTIATSIDGVTWEKKSAHTNSDIRGAAYGNDTFVVVGSGGIILQSDNMVAPVTTANPTSGVFDTTTLDVALFCYDEVGRGCDKTYYTMDGSEPTTNSAVYTSPISLDKTMTLKFFSTDLSGNIESANTEEYTKLINTTASPVGGAYSATQYVSLACVDSTGGPCADTFYTVDGSVPDTMSSVYSGPIEVLSDTTLNFFSVDSGGSKEYPVSEVYIVDTVGPETFAIPASGHYFSAQSVALVCTDDSSGCNSTYYTMDGSEPSSSSNLYSVPVHVNSEATLKFYSVDNAGNSGAIVTENYTIEGLCVPDGDIGIPGLERVDGGDDRHNLDISVETPIVDLEYSFTIVVKDSTGKAPQSLSLYISDRNDFSTFVSVDMTTSCTGDYITGAVCSYVTLLPPTSVHRFYYEAVLGDGIVARYPASGAIRGPSVEILNYNSSMVSIARDIDSANLDSVEGFDCTVAFRWVSSGLSRSSGNKGSYQFVNKDNPIESGEAYFLSKQTCAAGNIPELPLYSAIATPTHGVVLQPGWNIVGNPYGGKVMLKDIQIQRGVNVPISWAEAVEEPNNWVLNGIYYSNGADWGATYTVESAGGVPDASLTPWLGYWVYLAKDDDTYKLIFTKP